MTYRFDRFEFSRERGLVNHGEPVPLEPQAIELLAYLIDQRGRIVSKDEIVDLLWGGRAVTDAAISTQIRAVRRALGDDRIKQRFIRTLPKRGFEFVADVAPAGHQPEKGRPARRFSVMAGLGLVTFAALVVALWWMMWREDPNVAVAPRSLSIAVLPFDNLSGDPDLDYLADAFSEQLITDLARIRDAMVIARMSTFTYRDRPVDAQTAAAEMGVRYILEGSLRTSGEKVSVNAQLIDGESGAHLWSDRFERDLSDLFSLQDSVTGRIASVLRAELREADSRRPMPDASDDAWTLALRGNVLLFSNPSISDYQQANAYLTRATELDPTLASAWGGLGLVHFDASRGEIPDVTRPDSMQFALDAALRASSIDPRNAEPYWLLGFVYVRMGQPERAMAACETSLDLNPNLDCGWICAALVHMSLGDPETAIPQIEYALRLNPLFRPAAKWRYLGIANIMAGKDEAAIAALNSALSGRPNEGISNLALASALALSGKQIEAEKALARALSVTDPQSAAFDALRANWGWIGPDFERVLDGLKLAGLQG